MANECRRHNTYQLLMFAGVTEVSLEDYGHGLTIEAPTPSTEALSYQLSSTPAGDRMRRKRYSLQSCNDGKLWVVCCGNFVLPQ